MLHKTFLNVKFKKWFNTKYMDMLILCIGVFVIFFDRCCYLYYWCKFISLYLHVCKYFKFYFTVFKRFYLPLLTKCKRMNTKKSFFIRTVYPNLYIHPKIHGFTCITTLIYMHVTCLQSNGAFLFFNHLVYRFVFLCFIFRFAFSYIWTFSRGLNLVTDEM